MLFQSRAPWHWLCLFLGGVLLPLFSHASEFEQCCAYARSIAELNAAWSLRAVNISNMTERRQQCLARIESTQADFAKLANLAEIQSYRLLENSFMQSQLLDQLNNMARQDLNAPRERNRPGRFTVNAVDAQVVAATIEGDYLEHQMKELDAAGRLVMERRFRAFQDLVKLGQEFQAWLAQGNELAQQYWQISDPFSVRSQIEHRAALRELDNGDEKNPALHLARAQLLLHCDRIPDAKAELAIIEKLPEWSSVATALRARIEMVAGDRDTALRLLKQAYAASKQDVRVRVLRAQVLSMAGNVDDATSEWEALIKANQETIAAHRALSWLATADVSANPKKQQHALDHALLASKLSGQKQWSCEIALALAQAASGKKDAALVSAERAHDLSIGTQKMLCQDMIDQIKADQKVVWKFR